MDISAPPSSLRFYPRHRYQRAMFVTVPTDEIARDVRWEEDGARVVAVPYGLPQPAIPARLPSSGGLKILFAGELGWRKGVDRLRQSLAVQSNLVSGFRLCGKRTRNARSWALPPWWVELGLVSPESVRELLLWADVLILPSRRRVWLASGLSPWLWARRS
jgi:hypothetical protein